MSMYVHIILLQFLKDEEKHRQRKSMKGAFNSQKQLGILK